MLYVIATKIIQIELTSDVKEKITRSLSKLKVLYKNISQIKFQCRQQTIDSLQ